MRPPAFMSIQRSTLGRQACADTRHVTGNRVRLRGPWTELGVDRTDLAQLADRRFAPGSPQPIRAIAHSPNDLGPLQFGLKDCRELRVHEPGNAGEREFEGTFCLA